MDYVIYTYGGGEVLWKIFNGLSLFFKSDSAYLTGVVKLSMVIGGLYNPPLPSGVSVVSVVSVNGVAAPANPSASYLVPDVTINAATAVTVNIAAQNIPVGTVVNLPRCLRAPNAPKCGSRVARGGVISRIGLA